MNEIWHDGAIKPQQGRLVLIYNPKTRTPTMIMAHDCSRPMSGTIWAYVWDLIPKEYQND